MTELNEQQKKVMEQLAQAGFDSQGRPLPAGPGQGTNSEFSSRNRRRTEQAQAPIEPTMDSAPVTEVPLQEKLDVETTVLPTKVRPVTRAKEKVIDGRFIVMEDLPSNFHPYPGRDHILVRPFSVTELKLIARSIETGDADFITQAIDNCVNIDVYDLVISDYFFLYYWLRIQSYPNTPHYMEWKCDEVKDSKTCDHENVTPLTQKELKVVYLNDLGFDSALLDPRLDFPRVRLLQDLNIAEADKKSLTDGAKKDVTFSMDDILLVNAAKWIKEGDTLREKIEILEAQGDLELYEKASKTNKALSFGVYEYAMVSCSRCGAKRRYRVLLDAPRFFPFVE